VGVVPARLLDTRRPPFAFALIQVDGTDTSLVHVLAAPIGGRGHHRNARDAAVAGVRAGRIDDIESWMGEENES